MRITYRNESTRAYWERRWEGVAADEPAMALDCYPMKYAHATIPDEGRVLEAGCGNGRVLRFYAARGVDIIGMDYTRSSLCKLHEVDADLNLVHGDIRDLPYPGESFGHVLAFGLYHNLKPEELESALLETHRVLSVGGTVCASFRADNLHNRLIDWLSPARRQSRGSRDLRTFHKLNLTRAELKDLFQRAGFVIEGIQPVENMGLLYRFRLFRSRAQKDFNEALGRRQGYRLSGLGHAIQSLLMRISPEQFCNVLVLDARKVRA